MLGFFFIWFVYRKLTPQNIYDIKQSFKNANYYWILLSLVIAALSHLSRAWRWRFMLEPLGIESRFINSVMTVFVGYFVNLAIPRLGEFTRCGLFARYEKASFNQVLGTVIAERVADLFMLFSLIFITLILEFKKLKGVVLKSALAQQLSGIYFFIILIILVVLIIVFIVLVRNSKLVFFTKIRSLLEEIGLGIKTIITMKKRGWFIFHTLFIWLMYFGMLYIAIFSLPGTSNVPVIGVLSAFVMGSISIAATNGGLGAYPLGIREILKLYGVNAITGYAFGWIVWTAQTVMIVIFGLLSFLLLPVINKNYKRDVAVKKSILKE